MKILVTGGSGYLGTHVRRTLDGVDFSRRSGFDLLKPEDCGIVAEYDVIVHLAARLDKSPDAAEDVFRTNVEGTVNLLRHVREDAAFIFASTKDVYGRFADNYANVPENCPIVYSGQSALEWSKLVAERYVEFYANQRNFRSCIFRLSTVYAPQSDGNTPNFVGGYADAIDLGEPIALPGDGFPIRDFLHVDDLSAACQAFVDSVIRHGLYNLGGGQRNALTLNDLIEKLEKVSQLQAVVDDTKPIPNPTPMNYVSDLGLISQELDWTPAVTLEEGLKTLFSR